MRPPGSGESLVEVCPGEELPAGFCINLRRILVPTALDDPSATALAYASTLALDFGSELALLHVLEDPACAKASRVEAELRRCFEAIRAQELQARLFLRAGLVGEQVQALASALGANLIVVSNEYYRRFLSWPTHEARTVSTIQGLPCPVVLVHVLARARPSARTYAPAGSGSCRA